MPWRNQTGISPRYVPSQSEAGPHKRQQDHIQHVLTWTDRDQSNTCGQQCTLKNRIFSTRRKQPKTRPVSRGWLGYRHELSVEHTECCLTPAAHKAGRSEHHDQEEQDKEKHLSVSGCHIVTTK